MSLRTINLHWESQENIIWAELHSPNMSYDMLHDIDMIGPTILSMVTQDKWSDKPAFLVFKSANPSIFNLGGDLQLFYRCLENGDHEGLRAYGRSSVHALYRVHLAWNLPVNTIAMVEGQCYGGGMEGVLACDYIFASDSASFGLPEPLFNLFPGMGAPTFLADRVGFQEAERMCTSGQTWTPQEMQDAGVVDILGDSSYLEALVRKFIKKKQNKYISTNAFRQIRRDKASVDPSDLDHVVNLWLDGIKHMSMKDKRAMYKLIRAQEKLNATK